MYSKAHCRAWVIPAKCFVHFHECASSLSIFTPRTQPGLEVHWSTMTLVCWLAISSCNINCLAAKRLLHFINCLRQCKFGKLFVDLQPRKVSLSSTTSKSPCLCCLYHAWKCWSPANHCSWDLCHCNVWQHPVALELESPHWPKLDFPLLWPVLPSAAANQAHPLNVKGWSQIAHPTKHKQHQPSGTLRRKVTACLALIVKASHSNVCHSDIASFGSDVESRICIGPGHCLIYSLSADNKRQ